MDLAAPLPCLPNSKPVDSRPPIVRGLSYSGCESLFQATRPATGNHLVLPNSLKLWLDVALLLFYQAIFIAIHETIMISMYYEWCGAAALNKIVKHSDMYSGAGRLYVVTN